jgi:glycosyltransferase involved in cell wall biosynthesis
MHSTVDISSPADSIPPGDGIRRPAVSILIPVHNAAPYLRRCLDSALGQTFRDTEVVCVDDGSTDGSSAILDEYAARDPRLRVIFQKNHGALHARSEAARAALGEYFLCLDADDRFRPGIVEQAVAVARHRAVDVVEFSVTIRRHGFFQRRRRWYWGSPKRWLIDRVLVQPRLFANAVRCHISCLLWNKLVRREIFLAADGDIPPAVRATKVHFRNDTFFCTLLLNRAASYTAISAIGCDHTIWSTSVSWLEESDFSQYLRMLDEFFLCLHTLYRLVPNSLRTSLLRFYLGVAIGYTGRWRRFLLPQRLIAWQRLMDGFQFEKRASMIFTTFFFGNGRHLKRLSKNLRRRRTLALCLREWGRWILCRFRKAPGK